jgi:hypothetical protein
MTATGAKPRAEFLVLRNRVASGDLGAEGRANLRLRSKLFMAHARNSMASTRQGASAGGAVSAEDDHAWVVQRLEELDPGHTRQIAERNRAVEERSNRRRACRDTRNVDDI